MKKFTSHAFKTLLCLILAVMMIAGTTASSFALVRDDFADTGRNADLAGTGVTYSDFYIVGDDMGWSFNSPGNKMTLSDGGYYYWYKVTGSGSDKLFRLKAGNNFDTANVSFSYHTTANDHWNVNDIGHGTDNNYWMWDPGNSDGNMGYKANSGYIMYLLYYPNGTPLNSSGNGILCAAKSLPNDTLSVKLGHYFDSTTTWNEVAMTNSSNTWSCTKSINGGLTREFAIEETYGVHTTKYFKNTGTMVYNNCSNWTMTEADTNCKITTVITGSHSFSYNYSTKKLTVTYPKYSVSATSGGNGANPTVGTSSVSIGSSSTITAGAANTGYKFKNWTVTAGNVKTGSYSSGTAITTSTTNPITIYPYNTAQTVTLQANYEKITYSVSYNKGTAPTGGGAISESAPASQTKTYDEPLALSSSVLTSTGYTHDGWATSDGGTKVYELGDSYTANAAVTLYPHWTEDMHDVTIKAGTGGKISLTDNNDYGTGDLTASAGIATKDDIYAQADDGYTFTGWTTNDDSNITWDSTNNAGTAHGQFNATADDITITANFVLSKVPVATSVYSTYADGSSSGYAANAAAGSVAISPDLDGSGNAEASGNYTFTATANAGYEFVDFVNASNVAYTTSGNISVSDNVLTVTGINAAMHVRARFRRGAYVKFVDYNGTQLKAATWVDYRSDATPPSDPSRTGYTFTGWSPSYENVTAAQSVPLSSNPYVVTAQYSVITYTLTYTALGMDNPTSGYNQDLASDPTLSESNGSHGTLGTPDYDDTDTFTQQANAGYQFVGWYVVNNNTAAAETTLAANTAFAGTSNTKSVSLNNTAGNNCYHIYALYKKVYYLTFYNTTINVGTEEQPIWRYVSAPPKTVVVKRNSTTAATYTYAVGTVSQRGEDDRYANSDVWSTDHIVTSTGTYYEGNKLKTLAGDQVIATYSALATSDTITGAFFNNGIRYSTELEPDNLYKNGRNYNSGADQVAEDGSKYRALGDGDEGDDDWDYTYIDDTTLFADGNYYDTSENPYSNILDDRYNNYIAEVDNDAHTVKWTVTQNYYNIDLELATKKEITFKDTTGITITSKNADNYYNIGEDIYSSTPGGLKVAVDSAAQTSNNCTYTIGTPTYYKKVGETLYQIYTTQAAYDAAEGSKYLDTAFPITYNSGNGRFVGTMPAYDVVIDMNIVTSYSVAIGSWMVSDVVNGGTAGYNKWNKVASVTGSFSDGKSQNDNDIYDVADNARATTDAKTITKGTTVTYTSGLYDDYKNDYCFLGWYKGTASAPDLENGLLSTKSSFSNYTPKSNLHIWAVGTRNMYIGGSFYINNGVQTYVADGNANATWMNNNNHILMDYDAASQRYTYTFTNVTTQTGDTAYHFRVYEAKSNGNNGSANATVWNRWAENGGNKYTLAYSTENTIAKGRIYTSGQNTNAGGFDSYGYFQLNSDVISGGYNAPVTVYFNPENGDMDVKATYQWKMLYVSSGKNGYENNTKITNNTSNTGAAPNKTVTVAGQHGATVTASGTSWNPTGSYTEELNVTGYYVKTKNGVVRLTKTVTSAVSVSAFVVYKYDTGEVYSVDAVDDGSNTYHADITVSENMYVCPVMKKAGADMRVYVNSADLDKTKWGKLISLDAWDTSSNHVNGGYPGQLMIPSSDGNTWYADIVSTNLSGISFANHFTGTWIANQLAYNTVISKYNTVGGGNNRNVQTYDYREPVSLKENFDREKGEGDKLILSFTLKEGNTDFTSYTTYNNSSDSNGSIKAAFYDTFYNQKITTSSYSFEHLTDRTGENYTDLTGKVVEGKPTPSFYIICKGNTYYNAGVNQSKTAITYASYDNTYGGKWSVDWFVYDNRGNYITSILSDAYAHKTLSDGKYLSVIAQKVKAAGYPYEDRAVAISYDYPMAYSSDTTFRYSGQWYTTTSATPVKLNVEVALKTGEDEDGDIIVPANSYTDPSYGTASATYTGTSSAEAVGANNEYVTIKLSDAENKPVRVSATETNFLGWYTYDEETGKYSPIQNSSRVFNPSFNTDTTLFAVYEAKANYKFKYTGRDGSVKYYSIPASNLTQAEIDGGNIPRLTTSIDGVTRAQEAAALMPADTAISVLEKNLTVSTSNATESAYAITFDLTASQTNKQYTLTYYYYKTGVESGWGSDTATEDFGDPIDITGAANDKIGHNGPANKVFKGWYTSASGGTLVSTQVNFGMSIIEDLTVYAQYDDAKGTFPASQTPDIEKNILSLERYTDTSGTYYNDFIVKYQNNGNDVTAANCGILIIYQNDTASPVGSLTEANLGTIANTLRANPGKTANLSATNAKAFNISCSSLSLFNRINLAFKTSYATTNNRTYDAYAYYYDGSAYHFTAATSGTYNL